MARAVRYVIDRLRRPPWLNSPLPCLGLVTRDSVKLGGVGLTIVMLHEYNGISKDNCVIRHNFNNELELIIAQLENYALAQIESGDFIHKRDFKTGRILDFRSEYYTGEALFGLMHGSRRSPLLRNVAEGLMQKNYGVDVQSHWMAYAACKAAERGMADPKIVNAYMIALIDNIVRNPAYRRRNASTPIACRSEALCCFLELSRSLGPLRHPFPSELVGAARTAAAENLRLQLQWYQAGQFRRGNDDDRVQIDYVQHNGTAFLNWYLLHGT